MAFVMSITFKSVVSGILCSLFGNLCFGYLHMGKINATVQKKEGNALKIAINIDEKVQDTEILISCNRLTPEIEKILATLRILNQQMMVTKQEETYILDVSKIIYIEAVERKTFVYTKDEYYESKLKLYEMEERLMQCGFFRVSKSCLVQLHNIKSIKNDIDRKLRLTLESGEQIMVSRQYADEIKKRLGLS